MKNIFSFLILVGWGIGLCAQTIVQISQQQIPILVDREDNVLFYIRVDAQQATTLNQITMDFSHLASKFELSDIKAVRLYYSGVENVQRKGKTYYAPVSYLSRDIPGQTLAANASYSIKKAEVNAIKGLTKLTANQHLQKGVNYFWVSVQLKPQTSILGQLIAKITEIKVDGKPIAFENKEGTDRVRYLGIGVRHAGDDNAAAYRIPGIATSNKGSLLAVYDIRYNSSVDLQEYVDIGLSRSTDGGQTWDDMRTVMAFGEYGGLPKAQNGVGDPAILVDKKTGTIWVIAAWTHGMGNGRAWFNSQQGMDLEQTAQFVLSKSDDDGKTWSAPINITSQVKDPSWHFLLQGPGNGITMEDGTLVFAIQYIGADRIPNAGIMYSKDHGKTWKIHNHARTNTTEAQVAEVAPGVLMLNMRDNRGGSRAVYTTTDLGKTWKEHESSRTALQEPICMASLIKVKAEDNVLGKDLLLFSNPNTTTSRNNITIKASLDGGKTWLESDQLLLDEGYGWGYSCLTMIDKETVGIIYEGSTAHLTFQAIKLKDIVKSIQ